MGDNNLSIWSKYKGFFRWLEAHSKEYVEKNPENPRGYKSLAIRKMMNIHMSKLLDLIENDTYFDNIQSVTSHYAVRFGNKKTYIYPVWLQFVVPNKYHISIPKYGDEKIVTINRAIQTIKEFIAKAEHYHQENQ